ncbi:ATP-binding protein [Streptacidiphilus sp. 4-A2]|nr:ATP-binding protein [Streptacidiphilus sp. 4-A2]
MLDLAATPAAITAARRHAAAVLSDWGMPPEVIDTAMLLVSELATNALRHGQLADEPADRLRLRLHRFFGRVRVEVLDWSPSYPELRVPDDGAEDGRGLALVQLLSCEWGYYSARSYKVVWCEVACPLQVQAHRAALLEAGR